jgi:hypothetical protein
MTNAELIALREALNKFVNDFGYYLRENGYPDPTKMQLKQVYEMLSILLQDIVRD